MIILYHSIAAPVATVLALYTHKLFKSFNCSLYCCGYNTVLEVINLLFYTVTTEYAV